MTYLLYNHDELYDMGDNEDSAEDIEELFDGVESSDQEASSDDGGSGYTAAFEGETGAGSAGGHTSRTTSNRSGTAQETDWTPLIENLNEITELVKEYFKQSRENKKIENEAKEQHFHHQRRIVYTTAGTFLVVVGISAYMTSVDALSGDAFTFVLGTLFGAILTFLQNMMAEKGSTEN
ncbi:hypothetical protein [Halobiforma nitratireducens]|uniref:Uncharacterized protein n=1 Tax=Halobiforma nitratireducens JCM 10879 TaxID=1227454 RepID=M0LYV6_9EURY|nr:hypothetical protein [Halobiforma nitratireducens]EMA38621.1 hypothetical protein C446_09663 [Halobiforma nitratireducens JCM 10879]